jgi:gamma-glutamyltranspeptidase/glutathione hydrolase
VVDYALDSRPLIQKQQAVSANGMITCLHPLAAEAAIGVLRAGGNAVDAAVTAGLVLGVVEPQMSGIGGGGVMVVRKADGSTTVIDHGVNAPAAARPELYPLAPGGGTVGFYAWPSVVNDANIVGPLSIAAPGTIAGYATALSRFGTRSFADAAKPAIGLAADGFDIDAFTAGAVAHDLANLRRFPETAKLLLPNGVPLWSNTNGLGNRVVQPDLARTLQQMADEGPETFYQGELARRIVAGIEGGILTEADLAGYQPRIYEGRDTELGGDRGHTLHGAPYEGGAVTTAAILGLLDRFELGDFGPGSGMAYHLIAEAARRAFADRFAYLADHQMVDVPWMELRSPAYLDRRAEEIDLDRALLEVAGGVEHPAVVGHTTHLTVVDADRTVVALTQTHLDHFGSRIIPTGTGLFLNNGMMWFDPRPGRPNSIAGGKRALSAMSPIVVSKDGESVMAIGASGGRRILTAVAQVISNVIDHDLGPQAAVDTPRVHCDGVPTLVDRKATPAARRALERKGHQVQLMTETAAEVNFALPNTIVLGPHGLLRGGVDSLRPGTARGC